MTILFWRMSLCNNWNANTLIKLMRNHLYLICYKYDINAFVEFKPSRYNPSNY